MNVLQTATPRGRPVSFDVREETSDHNNVWSCCAEDEYHTREVRLGTGTAVDVGAHIGGVTVTLALDNPEARVIAVEALSENIAVLEANIEKNGCTNVTVLHRAASAPGKKSAKVEWNFKGGESGIHHRFIGNAQLPADAKRDAESETVPCVDLAELVKLAGGRIHFMKIDCEGGEYGLFDSPAVKDLGDVSGEYHAGFEALQRLLDATHVVTQTSGGETLGSFTAVPR